MSGRCEFEENDMTIHELNHVPDGLLDLEAAQLHTLLPGPTLLHLPGRRDETLFLTVLLHGNEDTGWCAVRALLKKYAQQELPRALSVFIGNVEAAAANKRYLPHQADYNRIWKAGCSDAPEYHLVQDVYARMQTRTLFASVDIHNNTGVNPHYACVNRLDNTFLHLARLFSRTVVYFTQPDTVQSSAFAALCPAVTVECGQPGQPHGMEHVLEFIDACLHLSHFPEHAIPPQDIDLFHTVAITKIPAELEFGFGCDQCDVDLLDDLDHLNFRELPAGTALGRVRGLTTLPLDVRNEQGEEVSDRYFRLVDSEIRTVVPFMPSMLTVRVEAVRQDCLCYLMERYPVTARS